jgi:hypothetical protein
MRCLVVLCCVAATALRAQQPTPPTPDSARAESARAESLRTPPPPPTPEQKRFQDGWRTASRGIAQLNYGLARVARAQANKDTEDQHTAGRLLAGWCGSARAFMRRGRPRMNPTVYSDSARLSARRLVTQLDTLIAYAPTCEDSAAAHSVAVAAGLGKRMKSYDTAARDFKVATGQRVDSAKGSRRP